MPPIRETINQISRPKLLMQAAKKLVQSQSPKAFCPLKDAELQALIQAERQCEDLRRKKAWEYSAEEHIVMLAKLIGQSVSLSKKGLIN